MEKTMKEKLLKDNLVRLMFHQAIPAVIGMIVIGLYPLMDGIFAGNILGEKALTACSVSAPITFINNGVATLIGIGSASILSRALGEGDQDKIDKIMGNLIYWVILLSLVITISGLLLAPYFLDILGASGEIKELGLRYVRIIFLGSIFVNFAQSATMVMRGEGQIKKAMVIMGLGAALNIALDPIFMIAMGQHGIEGVAIATLIAQFVQAGVTLYYFRRQSKVVKIGKINKNKYISKEMMGVGVSAMLMQVLFMVQQSLLYKQAFQYGGDEWATLMAATLRFYGFSFIPLWGMSQALQPIIGANFGAKQYKRVKETMKIFIIAGTILALVFYIPAQFFTSKLLSIFNVSHAILGNGIGHFKIFYSVYILYAAMIMAITFFQSIGNGKKAGIIVMLRQLILFVPAMLIFPELFGSGAVWWTEPLVDFTVIVISLVMMFKELNKLKTI
ncbi:MATE family efflux transporter [Facklamia miroungae]|uniref:Multidrug export protein MepA n=1 Tax=Facklamia miroungae TaxID=120956 RepID=A0A1G7QBF8_9LACT|nr:MATE family efflux transporter [Facklamia miroungae]NKZ28888.1 MATE family efflux transporter [Facklamia miroungae]SDF95833.1 putative efflux protein, MATE family [Facklamia miroungae]